MIGDLGKSRTFIALIFSPLLCVAILGKLYLVDRTLFDYFDHVVLILPELCMYLLIIYILDGIAVVSLRSTSVLVKSIPIISIYLVFINLLLLETIGLSYQIITGGYDFDYPLIIHTINNLKDLWPVFEAELGAHKLQAFIFIGVICLGLMFVPIIHSVKDTNRTKLEKKLGFTLAALFIIYGITNHLNEFPVRLGKPLIRENPKPIAYRAVERSVAKFWLNVTAKNTEPIRESFSKNTLLEMVSSQPKNSPNVAIIILESTGKQRLNQSYDGEKVMPFLDGIAKTGTEFTNAQTFIPHTSKALVSILCGVEPSLTMPILAGKLTNGITAKCLPELMTGIGYETAYFSPVLENFEYRRSFTQNSGFQTQVLKEDMKAGGFDEISFFGYEEDILLEPIDKWISQKSDSPFLMSILSLMPHHPYVVPEKFASKKVSDDPELNGHMNALRYQDRFLKKLFDVFRQNNVLDNTIIVIVGDHGEAFGEHGLHQHDTVPYDVVLNVPLVIIGPSVEARKVIDTPVSLHDILPTVVSLVGAKMVSGSDGYAGKNVSERRQGDEIFSYCYRDKYCGSIRIGDWKYIHYFGFRTDELFNLSKDPKEKKSILNQHPDRSSSMKNAYIDYINGLKVYQSNYYNETSQWMQLK